MMFVVGSGRERLWVYTVTIGTEVEELDVYAVTEREAQQKAQAEAQFLYGTVEGREFTLQLQQKI